MPDDSELDSLAGDIAAWTGDSDAGDADVERAANGLSETADQPDAAKAEQDLQAEQEASYDKIFSDAPDPDVEWQREHRRLADQALERAGIDPSKRHEAGYSRRATTRALYAAEATLRQDLGQGLSTLVQGYAGNLAPEQRTAVAGQVLKAFGFDTPQALGEADWARLQAYDQRQQAERQALAQLQPQLEQQVAAFAAQRPDFEHLRGTMSALIQAGEARDLPSAYDLARRVRGLPDSQQAAAAAADEARRSKVAAAKAAGTPNTKSAYGAKEDPLAGKSLQEAQSDAYDRIFGPGE